jgi:hypothetical protein
MVHVDKHNIVDYMVSFQLGSSLLIFLVAVLCVLRLLLGSELRGERGGSIHVENIIKAIVRSDVKK